MAETCYNFKVETAPTTRWSHGYQTYRDTPYRVTCKDCGATTEGTASHRTADADSRSWVEEHRKPVLNITFESVDSLD